MRAMTVKQLANSLSFSEVYVRNLAREGTIPAEKFGGKWLFNENEVRVALRKPNSFKNSTAGESTNEGINADI